MLQLLKRVLRTKRYQFLNTIEISKDNLIHNYQYLSHLNPKVKIAPVLKSNGYGHGLLEIAQILDPLKTPFFCVDSLYEAYHLYKASIKTPILIMGYINPENLKVKKLPFSYALFDLELAKVIAKFQPNAGVHIFVDTGMNREGVKTDDLPQFLQQLKKIPNLKVEGLMSHLASAENPNDQITKLQIKNFQKAQEITRKFNFNLKWKHLLASKAVCQAKNYSSMEKYSNLVRVGMAIYGIDPLGITEDLKPILELTSHICQIKKIKKGASVGYGGTFKAKEDFTAGILPIGYNDGVDRRLSNQGFVTINNIPCPIIGKVSMNITTVDLSAVQHPSIDQVVTVYSNNPKDPNSIQNAAKVCQTIPYELLVKLSSSTKRVVV